MIGQIIGNNRILKKIGEGGMGSVYLARDLSLERDVAIKIIAPELARDPRLMARFRVEAIAQAKLNHSNIVTIHSFDQQDDTFFIVMEYMDGKTLKTVIKEKNNIPFTQALPIFSQLLKGMDYAHSKGVVHRDIKPSNIFLTSDHTAKIGDFGIAKVEGIEGLTKVGTTLGSPVYSSPEQLLGKKVDVRTDVYSLGITLYEMLTGAPPLKVTAEGDYKALKQTLDFIPQKPSAFVPTIPAPVDEIVMKSIAKDPAQRFPTVKELEHTVNRFLSSLTPVPPPPAPPPEKKKAAGKEKRPPAHPLAGRNWKALIRLSDKRHLAVILILAVILVSVIAFLVVSATRTPAPAVPTGTGPKTAAVDQPTNGGTTTQLPQIVHPDNPITTQPGPSQPGPAQPDPLKTQEPSLVSSVSSAVSTPEVVKKMDWLIAKGYYPKAVNLGLDTVKSGNTSGLIYLKIAQAYYYDGEKNKARSYYLKALELDNAIGFDMGYRFEKNKVVYGMLSITRQNLSFTPSKENLGRLSFSVSMSRIKAVTEDVMSDLTDIFKKKKNRRNPILVIKERGKNKYVLQLRTDDNKLRGFIKYIITTLMKG